MRFEHHGVLRTITILCSRHASKNSDVICVPTPSQATTALLVGERPPRAANITLSDWMMNKTAYSPVTEPFGLHVPREGHSWPFTMATGPKTKTEGSMSLAAKQNQGGVGSPKALDPPTRVLLWLAVFWPMHSPISRGPHRRDVSVLPFRSPPAPWVVSSSLDSSKDTARHSSPLTQKAIGSIGIPKLSVLVSSYLRG